MFFFFFKYIYLLINLSCSHWSCKNIRLERSYVCKKKKKNAAKSTLFTVCSKKFNKNFQSECFYWYIMKEHKIINSQWINVQKHRRSKFIKILFENYLTKKKTSFPSFTYLKIKNTILADGTENLSG